VIVAGVDAGMYSVKVVLLAEEQVCAEMVCPCGVESVTQVAEKGLETAVAQAGISLSSVGYVVATGRGKAYVPFANESALDFMCLAQGIHRVLPSVHSVLDIGAEKALAARCSQGKVLSMAVNDQCAAGTGTYLQMVSEILEVPIEKMGELFLESTEDLQMNSTCTVFAETEIISLIHSKRKREDIVRGAYRALALRLYPILARVGIERDVALSGGVALHIGVRRTIDEVLGYQVLVPQNPLTVSALGAAVIAEKRVGDAT
jgi:predicted CoA-substrate-specific enzyme activase